MASGEDGNNNNALTIGLYPAVGVGLGLLIGSWLDHRYGWGSRGVITGVVLGMTAGMYLLFKEGMRLSK